MFKVKIGEIEYDVYFIHLCPSDAEREEYKSDPIDFRKRFGTVCVIQNFISREILVMKNADLSVKDNFNRNIGRKVSLARALQKLFPRDQIENRLAFWDAYFKARGGKW